MIEKQLDDEYFFMAVVRSATAIIYALNLPDIHYVINTINIIWFHVAYMPPIYLVRNIKAVKFDKESVKNVLNNYLESYNKNDEKQEWFDKINAVGKEVGLVIEHYIVSSGLKEIIEGTAIAKHFKRIYSNFYAYMDGEAYWPSQVVNYSSKIQYIYRVRKNALDDLSSLKKINQKMQTGEVLNFKNIIYLGDSQTDIPSFKVVKNSGGMSICVYEPNDDKSKNIAQKCFVEGRVNYFVSADYSEGSDLYNLVKGYIDNVIKQASKEN